MFVVRLTAEEIGKTGTDKPKPSWNEIADAITGMDGHHRPTLCLDGKDGSFLGIGGGDNGQYICFLVTASEAEFKLIGSPNAPDNRFDVFMGQWNIRSTREVTCLKDVLSVSKTFFETGTMCKDFEWNEI